jgi:hypothetical protein
MHGQRNKKKRHNKVITRKMRACMPKICIPLMTQLAFRSVSMETNMKTEEASSNKCQTLPVGIDQIHVPSRTLAISLSTIFLQRPTCGR